MRCHDNGHIEFLRQRVQAVEQVVEITLRIDVLLPVGADDEKLLRGQAQPVEDIRLVDRIHMMMKDFLHR